MTGDHEVEELQESFEQERGVQETLFLTKYSWPPASCSKAPEIS
jgi:hypothetical protein